MGPNAKPVNKVLEPTESLWRTGFVFYFLQEN
jgi:hypothetical protein